MIGTLASVYLLLMSLLIFLFVVLSRDGIRMQSEVNFLGRLLHPNLVTLLGYCWEDKELLLVYEYMAKGSLENHLFRSEPRSKFPFRKKRERRVYAPFISIVSLPR